MTDQIRYVVNPILVDVDRIFRIVKGLHPEIFEVVAHDGVLGGAQITVRSRTIPGVGHLHEDYMVTGEVLRNSSVATISAMIEGDLLALAARIARAYRVCLREVVDRDLRSERKRREELAMRAPDVTEWVIGFRHWALSFDKDADGRVLFTMKPTGFGRLKGSLWMGGREMEAVCHHVQSGKRGPHLAPAPDCQCGLYAWHKPRDIRSIAHAPTLVIVSGCVRARGVIQVHKSGFRAQYMQPVFLGPEAWIPIGDRGGRDQAMVRVAAEQLDLPIVPYDQWRGAAREYGDPIPKELCP